MNKKIFVKLLINDFRFILMNNLGLNVSFYKDKKTDLYVAKPKNSKELYFFDSENNLPKNAVKYSIFRKNTFLYYEDFNSEIPKIIRLQHKNVKFKMDMEFVK
ncbi:MAG: hypothetical protein GXO49_07810 [Chlorobi bacterium]|nr:hypothetical protein [Chlorobiota bacterium]